MKALDKKIDELFEYRRLPYLIETGGANKKEAKTLYAKLKSLQRAIYFLDDYLESNWKCTKSGLSKHWKVIDSCLNLEFGLPKTKLADYTKHIKTYQKHELQLREYKLPTRLDMEYFYFYKSCDVKLIRRLICDQLPKLNALYPASDWRVFDLITEINDDVEDIFEDMLTINGNRVLISLEDNSISITKRSFSSYIQKLSDANTLRLQKKGKAYQEVYDLSKKMIRETKSLLNKNLKTYQQDYNESNSKLYSFLQNKAG